MSMSIVSTANTPSTLSKKSISALFSFQNRKVEFLKLKMMEFSNSIIIFLIILMKKPVSRLLNRIERKWKKEDNYKLLIIRRRKRRW